jgi:Carboxypeptidase regulatory-like domain
MRLRSGMSAILFVMVMATQALAQGDQGQFAGSVRDSSGAFVSGAVVTVKNQRTGEERTTTTAETGLFLISNLKPSVYTIRAVKDGFAPIEYTEMPLAVGQELHLDFELKAAGIEESVTVVGTSPVLDLSSARMGVNVSPREVDGLPVNGRQMSQLLLQAPGSQNAGDGTWQDIRFSGRANEQNVIKYDGIEGSAIIDASPGNVNGENRTPFKLQASLENVQEFRVESSSYPAEYGTGTGGQVSVVTKSGSNQVHGAIFEYLRSDKLDARNHFDALRANDDSVTSQGPKSTLKQNQFGGSIGGPLMKDKAFFFGSYEGYRLDAGKNIVEAVPSASAWARAVPAVAGLRAGFLAPGAVILTGASTNADLEIAQLQDVQKVREHSFSGRLDFKMNSAWSTYVRVFHDQGTNDEPQGVTGRRLHFTDNPSNVVFNLQGVFGGTINETKVGYNAAPSTYLGVAPPGLEGILVSLGGTVANSGIAGQTGSTGLATPGQLVRTNSAGNGRSAPYDPYSLTFADTVSRLAGRHFMKFGADVRLIRMSTDQLGGITYTYSNLTSFLANTPTQVQYFGDLSEPSPFHNGASGDKNIRQEYYVGFAQDEWRVKPNFTLNFGLRYDYYAPLKEADNRIVKFNIDTGALDPDTTPLYLSKKNSFQPRVGVTFSPSDKMVFRGGVGVFVGPGQTEDQIQPVEAERISTTVSSGPLNAYPVDVNAIRANFTGIPNNRSYQPRAYANDYTLPEKVYEYTASLQREFPGGLAATVAYVGAQGRNLFLRSIANRTIGVQSNGATAGTQVREFDAVTCANGTSGRGILCPGSTIATIQRPFAEIDYKTSGGHDAYNSMQFSLTRRSRRGVVLNGQYTLGSSKGNTGGSNEAVTASNNARAIPDFDFDNGYNNFDIRHTFNFSILYELPGQGKITGGWQIGGIANARSGLPVPVLITRNDIAYVDAAGNVWNVAAADRTAVVNVPGGGQSRSTRRPDLIPGVDPFIRDGGRIFLNPAAFTTPKPGTWGNLERNSVHGPMFRQIDLVVSKRMRTGSGPNAELRMEVFNLFDFTNFANPPATLPNALPGAGETPTQANRTQPGQPFTAASAGTFGIVNSTVGTTVGLGTNRQVQFAVRVTF